MPTTNLGLATINQSDNISPTPINQNMEKIDALGVDYIVSQGTSGDWRYRRWKSGTYECWCRHHVQTASPSVPSSDFGSFTKKYPITFAEPPECFVTARQDGNVHIYVSYVEIDASSAVWYLGGMFDIVDVDCNIYAIGRVS